MIRTAYNSTHTKSGAKIETFLASLHGPGYLRIPDPIGMDELLESCTLSDLNVYSRAHDLTVDPRTFDAWGGKTFVPGTAAWSVGGQSIKGYKGQTEAVECWFEVQGALDGGFYVLAFAEVPTPDGPMVRVQLDVEFD